MLTGWVLAFKCLLKQQVLQLLIPLKSFFCLWSFPTIPCQTESVFFSLCDAHLLFTALGHCWQARKCREGIKWSNPSLLDLRTSLGAGKLGGARVREMSFCRQTWPLKDPGVWYLEAEDVLTSFPVIGSLFLFSNQDKNVLG